MVSSPRISDELAYRRIRSHHMSTDDPIEFARRATALRRQKSEATLPVDEPYASGVDYPASGEFTADLYHRLALANILLGTIGANEMVLTSSRIPLIHGLIDSVKRLFHDLALNYVRRLAVRQSEINHNVIRVLNELVAETAPRQDERIADLERRLSTLEERMKSGQESR